VPHHKLTLYDRQIIASWHDRGKSDQDIARRLGRHRTTIQRELRRNVDAAGEYLPVVAQQQAFERRSRVRLGSSKIAENSWLQGYLKEHLCDEEWSPDVLAGRLRREHPHDPSKQISATTVYAWIRRDREQGGKLYRHLQYGHKGYRKHGSGKELCGQIRNRIGIEERPPEVDALIRFGDWESDTVVGKGHKGAIASHVERSSKYTVLALLRDKRAVSFNRGTLQAFDRHRRWFDLPLLTMTTDNGKEFAGHEELAQRLGLKVYFAHPYSSWERGRNENLNRMIRRWVPKGTDFRMLYPSDVQAIE